MLLRHLNIGDLSHILDRHRDASPAPYLKAFREDPRAIQRARDNGLWRQLDAALRPDQEIFALKRSLAQEFQRTGDRQRGEQQLGRRSRALQQAALGLWLGHPQADLDYLQDLLFAFCTTDTWVSPAHDQRVIDLGAAQTAANLAEIVHVFASDLEADLKDRVHAEIVRRIYHPFADWQHPDNWHTVRHHWNHVCNGEIVRTALYDLDSPAVLAHLIHPAIQHMTYGLDGFTDDGGTAEGPSYWDYGFGHFVKMAWALYERTEGEINLMQDEKIAAICRFPLATDVASPTRATFADSNHGYLSAETALLINRFVPVPQLFGLVQTHTDGTLTLRNMSEIALYQGEVAPPVRDLDDYLLPDLGLVKIRGSVQSSPMTVVVLGGHNGANHNHNDVGSFTVHRGQTSFLVDPGRPVYRRETFSAERYNNIYFNSWGHSLPIIDGQGQGVGKQYYGTLTVEGLNQNDGVKHVTVNLEHAYPGGVVSHLRRHLTLDCHQNQLHLVDDFEFDELPRQLEEGFVTFEEVAVTTHGRAVQLQSETDRLLLECLSPGTFRIVPQNETAADDRDGRVLHRILFIPSKIEQRLRLEFRLG